MVFEVIGASAARAEPMLTEPIRTEPIHGEPAVAEAVPFDVSLDDVSLDDVSLDDVSLDDVSLDDVSLDDVSLDDVSLDDVSLEEMSLAAVVAGPEGRPERDERPLPPPVPPRPVPAGVIMQLLRSAVSLQAEGVLRTAGALAGAWGGVLDRTEWIERDARDLSVLAAAAVAARAPLPAGVDTGAGDPSHPGSVVESLLAGHEALVRVLRQLADAPGDDTESWRGPVRGILSRREEEILLLRAVGACGRVPADERYRRGRPPRP